MTGGPGRILALVVEDDPALRKLVQTYLLGMDFEVLEAGDGKTALAQLTHHIVDLVCLDLMLPEASGYDVCDFIRNSREHRDVPVLMMSARALPEDRAHAEELGVNAYLVKPFTKRTFTAQVQEVLSKAQHDQKKETA
ncbi:MAG: response regulator transcription factor [Myxococcaceae bacterium]